MGHAGNGFVRITKMDLGGLKTTTDGPSLSVSVSTDDIELQTAGNQNPAPSSTTGIMATGDVAFNVTTNNPSGYVLTMEVDDTGSCLKHVDESAEDCATISGQKKLGATAGGVELSNNEWGYSTDGGGTWKTPTITGEEVPATVKIGAKVNNQVLAGGYSNDLLFTLTLNPVDAPSVTGVSMDAGTGELTIVGTGMDTAYAVTVGGQGCSWAFAVSSEKLICILDQLPGIGEAVYVEVSTWGGVVGDSLVPFPQKVIAAMHAEDFPSDFAWEVNGVGQVAGPDISEYFSLDPNYFSGVETSRGDSRNGNSVYTKLSREVFNGVDSVKLFIGGPGNGSLWNNLNFYLVNAAMNANELKTGEKRSAMFYMYSRSTTSGTAALGVGNRGGGFGMSYVPVHWDAWTWLEYNGFSWTSHTSNAVQQANAWHTVYLEAYRDTATHITYTIRNLTKGQTFTGGGTMRSGYVGNPGVSAGNYYKSSAYNDEMAVSDFAIFNYGLSETELTNYSNIANLKALVAD
jgi:hypothetical protein